MAGGRPGAPGRRGWAAGRAARPGGGQGAWGAKKTKIPPALSALGVKIAMQTYDFARYCLHFETMGALLEIFLGRALHIQVGVSRTREATFRVEGIVRGRFGDSFSEESGRKCRKGCQILTSRNSSGIVRLDPVGPGWIPGSGVSQRAPDPTFHAHWGSG